MQHLWHTARNEAIAKGGKGSRTLDLVPAVEVFDILLLSCALVLVEIGIL